MTELFNHQYGVLSASVKRSEENPFTLLTVGSDSTVVELHMLSHEALALGEALVRSAREPA